MLELTSPAFDHGKAIPKLHTCEGKDPSPELNWTGAPSSTKSFALVMDDPDAPVGLWVHWVLYDIPAHLSGLPAGLPKTEHVLDGAKHGVSWGVDNFSRLGYGGPCPPPGKPHRYYFKLFALDTVLGLAPCLTAAELAKAMEGHIVARAELMGLFERFPG
ncbi:MAG: YbhB/YbcL family Raf kinase inhibitor-like protein [Elusimicrobia bacterium CG11_big_fil_rev_8_21_14_0_20_64_6]|nr:MAG: YbhB/YbcL family Raf kinase inhibitor-like protein [Elusimicrobia bacterium CG11_big_fil_rev_8_21_14_0_20_64_6]